MKFWLLQQANEKARKAIDNVRTNLNMTTWLLKQTFFMLHFLMFPLGLKARTLTVHPAKFKFIIFIHNINRLILQCKHIY